MSPNRLSTLYQCATYEGSNELTAQAKLEDYFGVQYDPELYPNARTQLKQMMYDYNCYLAAIEPAASNAIDFDVTGLLQQLLLDKKLYMGSLSINLFNATLARLGDNKFKALFELLYGGSIDPRAYTALSVESKKLKHAAIKPLSLAVQYGSVPIAQKILHRLKIQQVANACTELVTVGGMTTTPLHLAVKSGSLEMVKIILAALLSTGDHDLIANACLAMSNTDGESLTPLCLAAKLGLPEIFATIMQNLELHNAIEQAIIALHQAAAAGSVNIINQIFTCIGMSAAAESISVSACAQVNNDGSTPLHLAVASGSLAAVNAIVSKLTLRSITTICLQPNDKGLTPLHLAAATSYKMLTQILSLIDDSLLNESFDKRAYNELFYCAVRSGSVAVTQRVASILGAEKLQELVQLEKTTAQPKALFLAIKSGSLLLVNHLLMSFYSDYQEEMASKADTIAKTIPGYASALYLATQFGHADILEKIITTLGQDAQKACFASDPKNGKTALHLAAALGLQKMTAILLSALGNLAPQACLNPDKNGVTPLRHAILSGSLETVEEILKALGSNAKNACRSLCIQHNAIRLTALGQAAVLGHRDIVKKILSVLNDRKLVECLEPDDVYSLLYKALISGCLKVEDVVLSQEPQNNVEESYHLVMSCIGFVTLPSVLQLRSITLIDKIFISLSNGGKPLSLADSLSPEQLKKLASNLTPSLLSSDIFAKSISSLLEEEPGIVELSPLLEFWLTTVLEPRLYAPTSSIATASRLTL